MVNSTSETYSPDSVVNSPHCKSVTVSSADIDLISVLKVAAYYAVFTPLSTLWTDWLTGADVGWNEYLVLALTMIVNFTTEFLYDRFFVFGNSIDTNVKDEEKK